MTTPIARLPKPAPADEPDNLVLKPREVSFDWTGIPLHWIPGQPFATHMLNALQMYLPAGEDFVVSVFKEALPLIRDDKLRADVTGFIGQEAMHSRSHDGFLTHLQGQGLDPTPCVRQARWLAGTVLRGRKMTGRVRHQWLLEQVAFAAAIEHLTAFFGDWLLNNGWRWQQAGTDPIMLDLLMWHAAEEVEHRCVAFDVYQHLDGRLTRRLRTAVLVDIAMVWMVLRGTKFLLAHDPLIFGRRRPIVIEYARAVRHGLLPGVGGLLRSAARYVPRRYHPSGEGSTAQAVAYLAQSPAALAAERSASTP